MLAAAILLAAQAATMRVHHESFVDVSDGARLRVLTRGSDARLPHLLYQPFAGAFPQIDIGDPYFLPLTDTFVISTFDPRGVGESTGTFDAGTHADDLLAVARHVSPDAPLHLLSISSSTCPSVEVLRREPHRFASAVFTAPSSHSARRNRPYLLAEIERVWGVSPDRTSRLPALVQALLMTMRTPYARCHARWMCSGDFYHPFRYWDAPHYPRPLRTWQSAFEAMMVSIAAPQPGCDELSLPPSIPVLIVAGAEDYGLTPIALTREWAAQLRDKGGCVRFEVIPNASHAVHLEQTAAWADHVRSVLPARERRAMAVPALTSKAQPTLRWVGAGWLGAAVLVAAPLAQLRSAAPRLKVE